MVTLSFDVFWQWLAAHPNCILRAGTPEAIVFDDDDYHWSFATYEGGSLGIQVLRGKRFVAELLLDPELVTYVSGTAGDVENEHVFELISESETERTAICFFVMAHGYDDEPSETPGRVH